MPAQRRIPPWLALRSTGREDAPMLEVLKRPIGMELAALAAGACFYGLLCVFPPPPVVSRALMHPGWPGLLLLFTLCVLLWRRTGDGWKFVQYAFVLGLFSVPLIYKWQSAHYDGEIIGGLLPWSDAADYLYEAQGLLNGDSLTSFGARRPLFSSFLAVLIGVSASDFQLALMLMTLINALAVLFAVRLMRQVCGTAPAAAFLLISAAFYARFSGKTLSEQLGFALGSLSLFALLSGAQARSFWRCAAGLGLLALALNARAGAFFILPAVAVWLACYYRKDKGLGRAFVLACLSAALAFGMNALLLKVVAQPNSVPFSNYSYVLYGLASGNKGWTQVFIDHPGVTEPEVMPLAISKIQADPAGLIRGILGSYADFFKPLGGAFTFVLSGQPYPEFANLLLWGLVAAGLAYCVVDWRAARTGLTVSSLLGVLSSLVLLPPIDADGMRVFAATIPYTGLWLAMGIAALTAWIEKARSHPPNARIQPPVEPPLVGAAMGLACLLVVFSVPAPMILRAVAQPGAQTAPGSRPTCQPGQTFLQGRKLKNASIFLTRNVVGNESYVPYIHVGDFRHAIRDTTLTYPLLDEELFAIPAGQQISIGYNTDQTAPIQNVWIVSSVAVPDGAFAACGELTRNEQLQPYGFYYLKGKSLPPAGLSPSQQLPVITLALRALYAAGAVLTAAILLVGLLGEITGRLPAGRRGA
jgi:hypothetical protein